MNEFLFVLIGVVITLICVLLYVRFCTFRAQKPAEYDGLGPIMDIKDHLNGKIACEGVIYGPLGRVSSRFVAEFEAEWKGDSGVMREVFHYDSGSIQHRSGACSLMRAAWCVRMRMIWWDAVVASSVVTPCY